MFAPENLPIFPEWGSVLLPGIGAKLHGAGGNTSHNPRLRGADDSP